jgi:RNA polymerase sigma-70 factor (ECF subfamily)
MAEGTSVAVEELGGVASCGAIATSALARAKAGDLDAFEELMVASQKLVLSVASRLLHNREDARDAAQEVYLKLHRHLDRIDEVRAVEPWLCRVTMNVCFDMLKKRRNKTDSLDDVVASAEVSQLAVAGEQDARVEREQRAGLVRRAIQRLSGKERAALVLRDIAELSTAEVALRLGCTEVTVRSHISRARLKLHAALGGRRP